MSYLKFGFHTSSSGHGVDRRFYTDLDAAGIPFFAKGSDSLPFDAQQIAAQSAVPHVVIYRRSLDDPSDPCPSGDPDVPDYTKTPRQAAIEHWAWHKRKLEAIPEFNKAVTWVETVNEVDKERAEWLAEFALETAELTVADGYKWLAFGWSVGEPEPEHWEGPRMREFLDLVADNPQWLGIALHEYSLTTTSIMEDEGYLVGRFQSLLTVNPYVNIYLTEWGWTYNNVPDVGTAMQHYLQAGELYTRFPQVKGAATWALNGGWGGIAEKVRLFIDPLRELTLSTRFDDPPPITPPPDGRHTAIVVKLPQDMTEAEWLAAARVAYGFRHTMTASHDDMLTVLHGGNYQSYVKASHPERDQEALALVESAGFRWEPLTATLPPPQPPPPTGEMMDLRPYFQPADQVGTFYTVAALDGSWTMDMQLQREADDSVVMVKGHEYERWNAQGDYLLRFEDTSPGQIDGRRWAYTQGGARWIPTLWRVGSLYAHEKRVTRYWLDNCQDWQSDVVTDYIRFKALHQQWHSPANQNIVLENVIELWWVRGPNDGSFIEKYLLAPGMGYVSWVNESGDGMAIVDIPQGRPPLQREHVCWG